MQKKEKIQIALIVAGLSATAYLAADIMGIDMPSFEDDTLNRPSARASVIEVPPPQRLTVPEARQFKTVDVPALTVISSDVSRKLSNLRESQLNAAIAEADAKTRESAARGIVSIDAGSSDKVLSAELSAAPPQVAAASLTGSSVDLTNSEYENAALTYFDGKKQKAFIKSSGQTYAVFEGMQIGDLSVTRFKANGVVISDGERTRTLIAPKIHSIPAPVEIKPRAPEKAPENDEFGDFGGFDEFGSNNQDFPGFGS